MNKQRAVYLMLELGCLHKWTPLKPASEDRSGCGDYSCQCKNCGIVLGPYSYSMLLKKRTSNPDLTTWQGFGLMWEAAQKAEWWEEFLIKSNLGIGSCPKIWTYLINPTRFLDALYEFGIASERIKE